MTQCCISFLLRKRLRLIGFFPMKSRLVIDTRRLRRMIRISRLVKISIKNKKYFKSRPILNVHYTRQTVRKNICYVFAAFVLSRRFLNKKKGTIKLKK